MLLYTENIYTICIFSKFLLIVGEEFGINSSVKVIPTPGHTLSDVTVLVKNKDNEIVAITGKSNFW